MRSGLETKFTLSCVMLPLTVDQITFVQVLQGVMLDRRWHENLYELCHLVTVNSDCHLYA